MIIKLKMVRVYLAITIDTEPDCSVSWRRSNPLTFHSVLMGIPQRLQPLFVDFEAKPTYLISQEVLENWECVEVLNSLEGDYELGTHLHGEYVEPEKRYYNYAGTKAVDFACFDYNKDLEMAKLLNLTNIFKERMGTGPVSYRAGRFGADEETIQILEKLGYLIDSSVTPHISWKNKGGPDFTHCPEQPYHPDVKNICRPGNSKIVEVPVSIGRKKFFLLPSFWFFYSWLRPSVNSTKGMIDLIEYFIEKYHNSKSIVLNMVFHSMEVIPKASPYTRTDKDVDRFISKLRDVLDYCNKNGVVFTELKDIRSVI